MVETERPFLAVAWLMQVGYTRISFLGWCWLLCNAILASWCLVFKPLHVCYICDCRWHWFVLLDQWFPTYRRSEWTTAWNCNNTDPPCPMWDNFFYVIPGPSLDHGLRVDLCRALEPVNLYSLFSALVFRYVPCLKFVPRCHIFRQPLWWVTEATMVHDHRGDRPWSGIQPTTGLSGTDASGLCGGQIGRGEAHRWRRCWRSACAERQRSATDHLYCSQQVRI